MIVTKRTMHLPSERDLDDWYLTAQPQGSLADTLGLLAADHLEWKVSQTVR